jgi:hypothetical protein
MRLRFDPYDDDDHGFEETKQRLLHRFEEWLGAEGGSGPVPEHEMAADAGVALDWKCGYGDGDLASWPTRDVAEFLLDWCPRKLSVPQAECHRLPVALGAFLEFLDAEGLRDASAGPLVAVLGAIEALAPDYVEAMGDPSQFGMAKALFGAAAADGVNLGDDDGLQAWMADFNARPEDERKRLLPQAAPGVRPPRPQLPPVFLPGEAAVRASAAVAPVLEKFAALADYVGEGRKLTQKGHLSLADARALVDLLHTGDVMDPRFGERIFHTVSSKELPGLAQVFAWAKRAGVVRVVHHKVVATKGSRRLAEDPGAFFDRAVTALLDLGPLASQRDPDGWFAWPEVIALLDGLALPMLGGPYAAQGPFPLDDIVAMVTDAVFDTFEFRSRSDEDVARRIAADVSDMMDSLALAGVLTRSGLEDTEAEGGERRRGGSVELTPAGTAIVARLLVEAGCDAPMAGRLAEASAVELLEAADDLGFAGLVGEVQAWRARRTAEQAAREMAGAARQLEDPGLATLALMLLADIGVEVSAPMVRELAVERRLRGLATCWLVDHGLEPATALYDPDDVETFVAVLACRLATGGPEALVDALALTGSHDQQAALMGRLWRLPSDATMGVLEAIGATHPAKAVAKAARKACFQHRSWAATA